MEPHRLDEELVMRSLIIPHKQAHSDTLLRLELEQLAKRKIATLGQWPRWRWFAHKLHLIVRRPADDIYHVVRV